jgi:hypothetical protein
MLQLLLTSSLLSMQDLLGASVRATIVLDYLVVLL